MEDAPTKPGADAPLEEITIGNCGELKEGEDDGQPANSNDDGYESYPSDDESNTNEAEVCLKIANDIKARGTEHFKKGEMDVALKKYTKALRCEYDSACLLAFTEANRATSKISMFTRTCRIATWLWRTS